MTLVKAVAPSDACGASKGVVVSAVGSVPARAVPVADAVLSAPATVGSEVVPATSVGAPEPVADIEDVAVSAGVETPLIAVDVPLAAAEPELVSADCSTVTVDVDVPAASVVALAGFVIAVPGSVTVVPALVSVAVDSTLVEVEELMSASVPAPTLSWVAVGLVIGSSVFAEPAEDDGRSAAGVAEAAVGATLSAAVGAGSSAPFGAAVVVEAGLSADVVESLVLAVELPAGELLTDEAAGELLTDGVVAAELESEGADEASVVD